MVLVVAVVGKAVLFADMSHDGTYIFWMFMALLAIVIVALCVHQLVESRRRQNSRGSKDAKTVFQDSDNRRKSFRVNYPSHLRPLFIVDKIDNTTKRPLEYVVADISEDGIRFINDGSLGQAKELAGRLQFYNGEIRAITCAIVRRDGHHVCVHLKNSIAWSTLIKEQRRMMGRNDH